MALNPLVDSRDVRFVLFELLEIEKLGQYPAYADFDRDMYEEILQLAERIAVNTFYPANREGDRIGVSYDPQKKEVRTPDVFKPAYRAYVEAGFLNITGKPDHGGMGMPLTIGNACEEFFSAANGPLLGYPGLTRGAAELINNFGTDDQKRLYLDKMYSGTWCGTMCLTEPNAGSDVGALRTKAVRRDDGTYLISGQKIFITCGEHDMAENIIHPVLARIEGDPPGTRGISIFIVPKFLVNPDGTLGKRNDVVCSGIEHKMGLKASPTCTLNFGDNGSCVGYLLGEERKGMKIMFRMMNEARILVGLHGLALSSTAYMHAVTYARTRLQGAHVTQMAKPDAPQVAIINHPDVKRMLLWMKSYVEGMRMLTYALSWYSDLAGVLDGEERNRAEAMVELLTPILKAGNTDMAWLVTAEAIQVYGGYGYIADYPVEQLARDSKILSLFEGTNGIQSIDLVMRKILMNRDQYNYRVWREEVEKAVAAAKGVVDDGYIEQVSRGLQKLNEVVEMLKKQMAEMKIFHIFSAATPFQQAMYLLALAWLHLRSLTAAGPKLKAVLGDAKGDARAALVRDNREAAFYSGKVLSSQFFLRSEFPKFFGRIEALLNGETAVIKAGDEIFTGAPME
ncbi:MAG TPA: acyl-CoA dehydrogenase [Spirochaetota bacterium]|nr:acyl-CoA dehydrogenase [Spirochaetota bacterium]